MKKLARLMFTWIFVSVISVSCSEAAAEAVRDISAPKIAAIVSQNIRPYIEAADGLNFEMAEKGWGLDVIFLDKFEGKDLADLSKTLYKKGYDLFIAVGPGAARFVWEDIRSGEPARFYSMVLNPEKVLPALGNAAGIPLNISAGTQIEMIHKGIPSIKKIGLLYDPEYNHDFFMEAFEEAAFMNITLMPLPVSSRKDILLVLKDHWKDIDALWLIPDRTVISESIVHYVIKEALFNNIPVIGFNRFFYESGAALAFIFDYREVGRQCAREALRLISGEDVKKTPPVFNVWINERVIKKLGIETRDRYMPPVDYGP